MNIWRLQTKTASNDHSKIADYCLENNIIAIGWSLKTENLDEKSIQEREKITTFEEYTEFIETHNFYGRKLNPNVKRFYYDIKPNDLVWIRSNGVYYLGRVTENSKWIFNTSKIANDKDAANQITNIEWYRIGEESCVPGAIAISLIRGMTIQRINKTGVSKFSQHLFNQKSDKKIYKDTSIDDSFKTFYNLLSTEDCEDLLCLWLYSKYGYITIPSTNKKSTECYECILKDPKSGRCIYPQVKTSDDLEKKNFNHLNGEVWLFTVNGKVIDDSNNSYDNIHVANPHILYEFVETEEASKILPESILNWYKSLAELK